MAARPQLNLAPIADGGTVEVAHEALFREWTRLKSWLEPERARLEALRSLQIDAATWDRNGRDAGFLNHRNKRLSEATVLVGIERYRKRLDELEFDYLAACAEAERLAHRRTRRVQALVGVLALSVVAALVGWLNESYLWERLNWYTTARPYMLAQVRPHVLTPEVERALKPTDPFRECAKDCPEMVVVPAGEFMMGSPEEEKGRDESEGPRHRVTIARPFAVSKFEVTFEQWDACVSVGGCAYAFDGGAGRGTQPIINVSWNDARQYVAWLSNMTGQTYRLLSEAEWEYAARAGSDMAYSWGDEIGNGKANCDGCGSQWDKKLPAPVGSFAANAFGLHDMHGNVWEWCEDNWHDDYTGDPPLDGSVWRGGYSSLRVLRGGSWYGSPQGLRSAIRGRVLPDDRTDDFGFHVARTLLSPTP